MIITSPDMDLPIKPDQALLNELADAVLDQVKTAYAASDAGDTTDFAMLEEALERLLEIIGTVDKQARRQEIPVTQVDITELGEYGINLLEELNRYVIHYDLTEQQAGIAQLQAGFALWVTRHKGELLTLEPVVDALAELANNIAKKEQLLALFNLMGELIDAVAPMIKKDLDKSNPGRPWRLLNLNRAIVATRSHDTAAMQQAFDQVLEQLPEDAGRFFEEGMAQMDALDYPAPVRDITKRYYDDWNRKHRLH